MLRPFELHRPETLTDAATLMAQYGSDAAPYAGGTELLVLMKAGIARLPHLVDVKRLPGTATIEMRDGALTIGAAATHRAVERSPLVRARFPLVAGVAAHVANVRVRNVGTVGGNLAFADPHSDLATLFLTFDARLELVSSAGTRELPLDQFVLGPYETARQPEELLASVRLTPWPARTSGCYVKFGVHERPSLGIAVALTLGADERVIEARLCVGCVSPRPHRIREAELLLTGQPLAAIEAVADEAGALAGRAVDPISDLHGSAEYKRHLVSVFTRRALDVAVARAHGREPQRGYAHAVVV